MTVATCVFNDSLTTRAAAISDNPIINAPAVVDVRRGLRTAFFEASRPGVRAIGRAGTARAATTGPAANGLSNVTPRNTKTAPAPRAATVPAVPPFPWNPTAPTATPLAATANPKAIRRAVICLLPPAVPDSASMTLVRPAFKAGPILETKVVMMPTASPATTVRGEITSDVDGRSTPIRLNSSSRPR